METTKFEINAEGAILMDLAKEIRLGIDAPRNWRYNGGWTKSVTGLDKAQTNGYSILGDFCPKGLSWVRPGVYLDCNIGGSRVNQCKEYRVITVEPDGTLNFWSGPDGKDVLEEGHRRPIRDWAVRLWPLISQALEDAAATRAAA